MYVADRTAVSKAKAAVVVVVDRQNIAHAEQYWRFLLSSHRVNKHKIVFGQGLVLPVTVQELTQI